MLRNAVCLGRLGVPASEIAEIATMPVKNKVSNTGLPFAGMGPSGSIVGVLLLVDFGNWAAKT